MPEPPIQTSLIGIMTAADGKRRPTTLACIESPLKPRPLRTHDGARRELIAPRLVSQSGADCRQARAGAGQSCLRQTRAKARGCTVVPDNSYSSFRLIFSTICIKLAASDNRFAYSKGAWIIKPIVRALLAFVVSLVRSRLQHQLGVYRRSIRRPHVRLSDRLVWSWLSRGWSRWQEALVCVQSATILAWQHKCFGTIGPASAGGNRAGR